MCVSFVELEKRTEKNIIVILSLALNLMATLNITNPSLFTYYSLLHTKEYDYSIIHLLLSAEGQVQESINKSDSYYRYYNTSNDNITSFQKQQDITAYNQDLEFITSTRVLNLTEGLIL